MPGSSRSTAPGLAASSAACSVPSPGETTMTAAGAARIPPGGDGKQRHRRTEGKRRAPQAHQADFGFTNMRPAHLHVERMAEPLAVEPSERRAGRR